MIDYCTNSNGEKKNDCAYFSFVILSITVFLNLSLQIRNGEPDKQTIFKGIFETFITYKRHSKKHFINALFLLGTV